MAETLQIQDSFDDIVAHLGELHTPTDQANREVQEGEPAGAELLSTIEPDHFDTTQLGAYACLQQFGSKFDDSTVYVLD